jgi:hypothetical protein
VRRTTRGTNKWYTDLLRTGFEFYERACPILQKTGLQATRGTNKWYRELLRTGFEFYEQACPVLQKTGMIQRTPENRIWVLWASLSGSPKNRNDTENSWEPDLSSMSEPVRFSKKPDCRHGQIVFDRHGYPLVLYIKASFIY